MTQFIVEGFYQYVDARNGRGNLSGEIDVDENGAFNGQIFDAGSSSPNQLIRGHFRSEDGLDRLLFLKFPQSMRLANLAYELTKPSNGSYEGRYSGEWAALPVKVGFFEDYGIFVAQIDMSMADISDVAELNVRKKE